MIWFDPAEGFNDERRVAQVERAGSGNVTGSEQHGTRMSVCPDVSRSDVHSLDEIRELAAGLEVL